MLRVLRKLLACMTHEFFASVLTGNSDCQMLLFLLLLLLLLINLVLIILLQIAHLDERVVIQCLLVHTTLCPPFERTQIRTRNGSGVGRAA